MLLYYLGRLFRTIELIVDVATEDSRSKVVFKWWTFASMVLVSNLTLATLMLLFLPVLVVWMCYRVCSRASFGPFIGKRRIALWVLAGVGAVALLELSLAALTGTFSWPSMIKFVSLLMKMSADFEKFRVGSSPETFVSPLKGKGYGRIEIVEKGIRLVLDWTFTAAWGSAVLVAISLGVSLLAAFKAQRGMSGFGACLLSLAIISLALTCTWYLGWATVMGALCASTVHSSSLRVNDVDTQQFLAVLHSCAAGKSLQDALRDATVLGGKPPNFLGSPTDPWVEASPLGLLKIPADTLNSDVYQSAIDCKEIGTVGVQAFDEMCTGLLPTFDSVHATTWVLMATCLVLMVLMLGAWRHGKTMHHLEA